MAKANQFGVAFSNPCFELWCLFHLRDQTAHIERADALHAVKEETCMPDYYRGMTDLFSMLETSLSEAEKRVINLGEKHISAGDDETHSPSTSMDRLIAHLRKAAEA